FVGRATINLANAVAQGRDPANAVPHYEHGIAILERVRGPESPAVGAALGNFGRLLAYLPMPQPTRAIAVLERARAIEVKTLGPEHADLAYVDNNLAVALLNAGRLDEARAAAESGLRIATARFGPEHGMVAELQLNLADIAMARHDTAAAVQAFEASLAIHERAQSRPAQRAQVRFHLAQALIGTGEVERALALTRTARAEFLEDGSDHGTYLELVDAFLATHGG
ncbi:MAG TPA: tetratricopeptide repeat protein, partial [Nannocystaceae bacterium]|nr:tetratricopeptide repeat protein [Nannocystaceae bacterium]